MSLTTETIQTTGTVGIHLVRCQPKDHACGPVEYSSSNILVFPLRGVFIHHGGPRERVVADNCHALFFNAWEPYRVSHPVAGGDQCLVVAPSSEVLFDLRRKYNPRKADREGAVFARTYVPLGGELLMSRRLFWYRVRRQIASRLETEETAIGLLALTMQAECESRTPPGWSAQTQSRCREMTEATQIALAARPEVEWRLDDLAKRVHSSPFHLSRTFRQCTGMPLHRYHLLARMAVALNEVMETSRDLTAIALELGFSSHSHFTARFRLTFGMTPSALRSRAKRSQVAELSKILTAGTAARAMVEA